MARQAIQARNEGHLPGFTAYLSSMAYSRLDQLSQKIVEAAGNIKADKAKSTEKIDGAIALIMALDRAIRCRNVNGESVYESRGLLVF